MKKNMTGRTIGVNLLRSSGTYALHPASLAAVKIFLLRFMTRDFIRPPSSPVCRSHFPDSKCPHTAASRMLLPRSRIFARAWFQQLLLRAHGRAAQVVNGRGRHVRELDQDGFVIRRELAALVFWRGWIRPRLRRRVWQRSGQPSIARGVSARRTGPQALARAPCIQPDRFVQVTRQNEHFRAFFREFKAPPALPQQTRR